MINAKPNPATLQDVEISQSHSGLVGPVITPFGQVAFYTWSGMATVGVGRCRDTRAYSSRYAQTPFGQISRGSRQWSIYKHLRRQESPTICHTVDDGDNWPVK